MPMFKPNPTEDLNTNWKIVLSAASLVVYSSALHAEKLTVTINKIDATGVGLAAGGYFDPHQTGKHEGPTGHGHQGDLAVLEVNAHGRVTQAMTVVHLKLADIKGCSIIIHEGGDNFADEPKPLGDGGARIACGVIQ